MGIQLATMNLIQEKAKSKADGCYRFRGVAFRVRNNVVTHLASFGEIYEFSYGFLVRTGTYEFFGSGTDERVQKILRGIK